MSELVILRHEIVDLTANAFSTVDMLAWHNRSTHGRSALLSVRAHLPQFLDWRAGASLLPSRTWSDDIAGKGMAKRTGAE
jgi:hypothetical protein